MVTIPSFDELFTVDFETEAIGARPNDYPPKPVSVSIRLPDGRTDFLSWGHPEGNNATFEEAKRAVRAAFNNPVLFHNAAFDMEVAWAHMGIPFPKVFHDSMVILFLYNPHALSYALKRSAEDLLKMPPDEQDAVRDWILANVPGATKKNFGAHISKAPAQLVAPYANGDVDRTFKLFVQIAPNVIRTQGAAYERELRLMPHLLAAEQRGIRVDRKLLLAWHENLTFALHIADERIRNKLVSPASLLNIDSNDELAKALNDSQLMKYWETTDGQVFETYQQAYVSGSKISLTKKILQDAVTDRDLADLLAYRNTAATLLRTFVQGWLDLSAQDGRLHTKWHQIRGMEQNGTRTGRIASAQPNLTNVPNPQGVVVPEGLMVLPELRRALMPEEGCVWMSADYSQQELRMAAHFEDGEILHEYRRNPKLDLHDFAKKVILERTNHDVSRKRVKTVAFATIYGAGLKQLAAQMDATLAEAEAVRDSYFMALPGLRLLSQRVQQQGHSVGFVKTAGGRLIPMEPRKMIEGRMVDFSYKLLNHLVQGSSADQTKEAIVRFCEAGGSKMFLATVYDEICISVPVADVPAVAAYLRYCMTDALPLDVPMMVDVDTGPNWGDQTPLGE